MSTKIRTIITTTCDRPRCNRVVREREQEADAPPDEEEPDLVVKRAGQPDILYQDVCETCAKATDNLILGIEKKPRKKEAEPEATVPVDPNVPRFAMGVWIQDGGNNYSHKSPPQVGEKVITIPALEGVTDPAEAGALISAHNEPPAGGEAGSDQAILQLVVPE